MQALCPNCTQVNGDLISREFGDSGGVIYTFECPRCDHKWKIPV